MSSYSYSSLLSLNPAENDPAEQDMAVAVSSYLSFDMELEEDSLFLQQESGNQEGAGSGGVGASSRQEQVFSSGHFNHDQFEMGSSSVLNLPKSRSSKIAFKTRSEVEVLDDGYRWRKYGKKMVKNSPNPRNYYRCSREGCHVKKRIEREREDSRYVITTYDGVHNHPAPSHGGSREASAARNCSSSDLGECIKMEMQGCLLDMKLIEERLQGSKNTAHTA